MRVWACFHCMGGEKSFKMLETIFGYCRGILSLQLLIFETLRHQSIKISTSQDNIKTSSSQTSDKEIPCGRGSSIKSFSSH
jgi:hypothetical protein